MSTLVRLFYANLTIMVSNYIQKQKICLIKKYRYLLSIDFCVNPFKSPYRCFNFRLELVNKCWCIPEYFRIYLYSEWNGSTQKICRYLYFLIKHILRKKILPYYTYFKYKNLHNHFRNILQGPI